MTKKKEDNRDVFDKALDYAPVAGAVLGGVLANKAAKRFGKPRGQSQKAYEAASADDRFWATGMGGFSGGAVGAGISGHFSQKKKRRK